MFCERARIRVLTACARRFNTPAITAIQIMGEELTSRIKPVWDLDEEGELRTAWRDTGVPNFWFMMGNLMWCRFHSKHVALRKCLSLFYLSYLYPFERCG